MKPCGRLCGSSSRKDLAIHRRRQEILYACRHISQAWDRRVEPRHLLFFVAVAEKGSLAMAAERRHVQAIEAVGARVLYLPPYSPT